jgi:hypothetical protein
MQSNSSHSPGDRGRAVLRLATAVLAAFTLTAGSLAAAPAAAPKISASASRQIQVLEGIKQAKSGAQSKIQSRLFMAVLKHRQDARLTALPTFRFVQPETDGRILIDIDTRGREDVKPVINRVQALGGEALSFQLRYRAVRARLPIDQVEALAAMSGVLKVQLARQAYTSQINTSEGDVAHRAAEARNFFGITGAGVKICVLSDGVSSLAAVQATGDLPAVDVLPGQAGRGDGDARDRP